ncbi:MAG: Xaa-Pro dipeptidase [Polyangiales bacterium]
MDRVLLTQRYQEHLAALERDYARVLGAAGYDAVVIHSGSAQLRCPFDDQYWPVRITPHFQHWLPLPAADSALVIRPGKRPKLVWTEENNFWEKPEPFRDDFWQGSFDIVRVDSRDKLANELPTAGRVASVGEAAAPFGRDAKNQALTAELDQLRTRKSSYEELCLVEANRRAAAGHAALAAAFRSGDASEFELHLLFLRATEQDDGETPYKNIVALGENAATLHHISYRKTAAQHADGQSLLVDAGASFLGYGSDITRTHVKGKSAAASAFAGLVRGVEQLQARLCRDVRVGDPYEQLHDRAHDYVAATLRETGVVKISDAESVSRGITRAFFPHGLGHSLGLQTHDVGCASVAPRADNPFLRNTSAIEARQCFTIEPGVYFIDSLLAPLRQGPHASAIDWRLVDQLKPLGGVRIEDDLVVVGNSEITRNLTRPYLPTSAQ